MPGSGPGILGGVSDPEAVVRPARTGRRVPKIVVDLFFTLVVPISLLARNFLGMGFGFGEVIGTVTAYVLAGLVPAVYIILDTLRTRAFNPITILAAGSALAGGFLAFLRVEGAAFALKDSYASIVAALVMGGSLAAGRPFFAAFVRVVLGSDGPERASLVGRLLAAPEVRRGLRLATVVILVESTVLAGANFAVNLAIVTGSFGTPEFNDQVAQANVYMRPVSLASSLAAYALAFYLVQAGAYRAFGPGAKLLEDELWEALDQGAAAVPARPATNH